MYPWEIEKFIKDRNYQIGGDDLNFIINTKQHPQLDHIKYNPYNNGYEMWDKEGNYYKFTAIPYNEAKKKGLVKNKEEEEER